MVRAYHGARARSPAGSERRERRSAASGESGAVRSSPRRAPHYTACPAVVTGTDPVSPSAVLMRAESGALPGECDAVHGVPADTRDRFRHRANARRALSPARPISRLPRRGRHAARPLSAVLHMINSPSSAGSEGPADAGSGLHTPCINDALPDGAHPSLNWPKRSRLQSVTDLPVPHRQAASSTKRRRVAASCATPQPHGPRAASGR